MVGLSMVNRRAAPPPRLDLEIVRRQQQKEKQQQQQQGRTDPNTPTGPLTPNRPLIVSELPAVAIPHATTSKPALLTPSSTRPSTPIPTSTLPLPDPATPTLPVPRTTFHTSTRVPLVPSFQPVPSVQPARSGPNFGGSLSQPSLSPTNTVFVTQPPQTVTVTAPAVVPTLPSTSHTSSTIPLPSEAADTTPQPSALPANNGVSFTTGAGVVESGGLIGKSM
ncbi:hypothetical protein CCHR01_05402 [Colletotrichum chrysophilum]|uniref:Uncharacterized protein n=1 Tax=Colletotrichum chrysophilum TaxID=1836956 RepID=A0AAD9EHN7_9PEZI|nr:hypothetical protein CCHR01_05402 [Colletotrichum chrysophilum]